MGQTKEELSVKIEEKKRYLHQCIEAREPYDKIYQASLEVDRLIEQYLVADK